MLFIEENDAYTFEYNGKPRVAIVLEVQNVSTTGENPQALCWELTRNQFRRYNIKSIINPINITFDKVHKYANSFFANRSEEAVNKHFDNLDCMVFHTEKYTFIVHRKYLDSVAPSCTIGA